MSHPAMLSFPELSSRNVDMAWETVQEEMSAFDPLRTWGQTRMSEVSKPFLSGAIKHSQPSEASSLLSTHGGASFSGHRITLCSETR